MVNKDRKIKLSLDEAEIKKIMDQAGCLEGYPCIDSKFSELCLAEPYGNGDLLECKEENPISCPRAQSYGSVFICKCNVRNYIARNLEK